MSGCGGEVPKLTPTEKAEVDKYIKDHGKRDAMVHYLWDERFTRKSVLNHLKYFVSRGADVNVKDKHGTTPLYYPALNGDVESVEFLVSKGADVNVNLNDRGMSLLHLTVMNNCNGDAIAAEKIVRILVSHGADVNVKNDVGKTAIHYAETNSMIEYLKSVETQSQ